MKKAVMTPDQFMENLRKNKGGTKEIKPFTAEWWLELATNTDHEFSRYFKHLDLYDYVSLNQAQRVYCAKRYAEAYHRERVGEFIDLATKEIDDVGHAVYELGVIEERKRILGIIEEFDFWFPSDRESLTQKIKG